jgi:hypothetical protein
MLIREVTAQKPLSPQQQRVTLLQRQLDQAREAVKRQQLAARQARLNQQRAALSKAAAQ